jgi:glutamine amidotransferase
MSICAEVITNYEVEYASALQRIIFTEPSPEKSGDVGEKILGNFLNYKHFN